MAGHRRPRRQALHAAQTHRVKDQPDAIKKPAGRLLAPCQFKGEESAAVHHLLTKKPGLRIRGKTGIMHPRDLRTAEQPLRDGLSAAWAAYWQHIDRGENVEENQRALRHAMEFAGLSGDPVREYNDSLHQASLHAALRSNSMLAVVMLADVFAQTTRFNAPGSASPENWSARMPESVEDLDRVPALLAKTQNFSSLIRETGRRRAC